MKMISGLEHHSYENDQRAGALLQAERAGAVRPAEERVLERPCSIFLYLKGALQEVWGGLCVRECSDRRRGNGSKLKKGRFRLGRKSLL